MSAHFDIELELIAANIWPVAGLDEVGRGPLAGPVCVADPPRHTSTRGFASAICRRTNGRQADVSCGVGVRLPGGRQGTTLAI